LRHPKREKEIEGEAKGEREKEREGERGKERKIQNELFQNSRKDKMKTNEYVYKLSRDNCFWTKVKHD
jgi:hypothetical protein